MAQSGARAGLRVIEGSTVATGSAPLNEPVRSLTAAAKMGPTTSAKPPIACEL